MKGIIGDLLRNEGKKQAIFHKMLTINGKKRMAYFYADREAITKVINLNAVKAAFGIDEITREIVIPNEEGKSKIEIIIIKDVTLTDDKVIPISNLRFTQKTEDKLTELLKKHKCEHRILYDTHYRSHPQDMEVVLQALIDKKEKVIIFNFTPRKILNVFNESYLTPYSSELRGVRIRRHDISPVKEVIKKKDIYNSEEKIGVIYDINGAEIIMSMICEFPESSADQILSFILENKDKEVNLEELNRTIYIRMMTKNMEMDRKSSLALDKTLNNQSNDLFQRLIYKERERIVLQEKINMYENPEKMKQKIISDYDAIRNIVGVDKIAISRNNNNDVILTTKCIYIVYKGVIYKIGRIECTYNSRDIYFNFKNLDLPGNIQHPHIKNLSPCWGAHLEEIKNVCKTEDNYLIVESLMQYLMSFTAGDSFCDLAYFRAIAPDGFMYKKENESVFYGEINSEYCKENELPVFKNPMEYYIWMETDDYKKAIEKRVEKEIKKES